MISILVLFYILFPVLIIYACQKVSWLNKIGAVLLAYAAGIILGNVGIFPRMGEFLEGVMHSGGNPSGAELEHWLRNGLISKKEFTGFKVAKIQDVLTSITVPLALPLLLFSLQVKKWVKMSGKAFLSMFAAVGAAISIIVIGYFIFGKELESGKEIAGMLVGLYTGGTPNLASLKEMLGVDAEVYIITHTYDTAVSVVYLLFLITIGKYLFRSFLPPYGGNEKGEKALSNLSDTESGYQNFFVKENLKPLSLALLIAVGIFAVSGLLSFIVPGSAMMLVVILSITTLSIIVSLSRSVNSIPKTYELGMYFIVTFSLVVASMADINKLLNISSSLFYYITFVVFGSLTLHALLSKVFKVDADTFMVTSTALICSPPFVPMVAGPLGNKEVIISGLTVGIVGYAVGNYLGVLLVMAL